MAADSSLKGVSIPSRIILVTNIIAIIAAASAVILSNEGTFPFQGPLGLYRILPGDILIDFIWIWVIAGVMGVLLILLTPSLAGLYLWLHRVITAGAYEYHQEDVSSEERTSTFRQMLLPGFVSLGLSFTLVNISDFAASIFVIESFDSLPEGVREPLQASMPLFFVLLLIAAVITFLFAPAWLLEDRGIICSRKGDGRTAYIEGVGNWYLALLKGFAGISTILAYFFISTDMINWYQLLPTYGVEVPIWLFLIPVLVVIVSPIIALAPISVSFSLYQLGYVRNAKKLQRMIEKQEMNHVEVTLASPRE